MIFSLLSIWACKSTVLALLTLLAIWAAKNRTAADKAFILQLSFFGLLLLPLLGPALPVVQVGISTGTFALPPVAQAAAAAPHGGSMHASAAPALLVDWPLLLIWIYVAGAALLLARLIVGLGTLRWWTAEASEMPHRTWQQVFAQKAGLLRVRPPKLLLSTRVPGPLSWGLLRPVILVDEASAARIHDAEAVLGHELAHVVRKDWAALMLARTAVIVFWFNPLVWLLWRKLEEETEKAADLMAARELGSQAYAGTLVHYALRARRQAIPAPTISAGRRRLTRRIHAVLGDNGKAPAGMFGRAGAAIAVGALIMPLASFGVASASVGEGSARAEQVFAYLDAYYAVPAAQRTKVTLAYVLSVDGKPPLGMRLILDVHGRRFLIPTAADGRVERLPSPAELAAHAHVIFQAQTGQHRVDITPSLQTTIVPAREISAADCALAVAQVQSGARRMMGLRGFLLSRVRAVTFPGAGSGVAILSDGRMVPLPRIMGAPAFDPAAIPSARLIRLARMPTLVDLE